MSRVWTYFFIAVIGCYQGLSVAQHCTAPGKFANDHVDSCAGYTMCLIAGAGNFMQLNMTCPPGFIYNHVHAQCTNVTGYKCEPGYNCTQLGNFPDPNNDDCSSYIACIDGLNNVITARSVDCPLNYTFSPFEKTCTNDTDFKCNRRKQTYFENELVNLAESTESSATVHCLASAVLFGHLLFVSVLK